MAPEIKTELKIPDLWYDVYARVIPGAAFVSLIRVDILGYVNIPSFEEMVALLAMGYFAGLLSQPISSRITKLIEDRKLKAAKKKLEFFRVIERALTSSSREVLILSKMHGEATFFVQLAYLSFVYFLVDLFHATSGSSARWWILIAVPIFLLCAREVSNRRFRRGKEYVNVYNIDLGSS